MLNIKIIPCLTDNYSFIIHDDISNVIGVIDPSEFDPIDDYISKSFKKIDYILNTHHHFDHIGGNLKLKKKYNSVVVCSKIDKERVPGAEILLSEGDNFKFGKTVFQTIFTPGHTSGHIIFFF